MIRKSKKNTNYFGLDGLISLKAGSENAESNDTLILTHLVSHIKSEYVLPPGFFNELNGYLYLVTIYLSPLSFKRERLLYYHTDPVFRTISDEDYTSRLIQKLKLICLEGYPDCAAEHELKRRTVPLAQPHFKQHYVIKEVFETHYFNVRSKFTYQNGKELAHALLIRPRNIDKGI